MSLEEVNDDSFPDHIMNPADVSHAGATLKHGMTRRLRWHSGGSMAETEKGENWHQLAFARIDGYALHGSVKKGLPKYSESGARKVQFHRRKK